MRFPVTFLSIFIMLFCPINMEAKKKAKKTVVPQMINFPSTDINNLPYIRRRCDAEGEHFHADGRQRIKGTGRRP